MNHRTTSVRIQRGRTTLWIRSQWGCLIQGSENNSNKIGGSINWTSVKIYLLFTGRHKKNEKAATGGDEMLQSTIRTKDGYPGYLIDKVIQSINKNTKSPMWNGVTKPLLVFPGLATNSPFLAAARQLEVTYKLRSPNPGHQTTGSSTT